MAFKCPVCSKPTKVTDTRGNERKRACGCGNIFVTHEAIVGDSIRCQNTELKRILQDIKNKTLEGL